MRELVNEAVTIDTKLFIHDHSQLQVFAVKDETGKPDKTVHFLYPPVMSQFTEMLSSSVKQTALRGVINGHNVKKSITKFDMYLLLCNFQRLCRKNLKFIIRHCGGIRAFIHISFLRKF